MLGFFFFHPTGFLFNLSLPFIRTFSLWNMENVNLFPVEITVHQGPAVAMQFLIELLTFLNISAKTFRLLIYFHKVLLSVNWEAIGASGSLSSWFMQVLGEDIDSPGYKSPPSRNFCFTNINKSGAAGELSDPLSTWPLCVAPRRAWWGWPPPWTGWRR